MITDERSLNWGDNNLKHIEIKEAALSFFTTHGYEGASLSQIADAVGIKKQSIYSHFKGKDDLFLQVLRDAKNTELTSKLHYFQSMDSNNPEKALYGFLRLVTDLFQQNEQMKFWLRVSFFPPAHLAKAIEDEVMDIEEKVQTALEERIGEWINSGNIALTDAKIPALAFLAIVDSIMLELVYVNDEKRLIDKMDACWQVFWRGIST